MSSNLQAEIAVITGSANGIGKAIAIRTASYGINIALVDININALNKLKYDLNSKYPLLMIESFICDVSSENNIKKLVNDIKLKFNTSSIQFLFNNVGISSMGNSILYGNIKKLEKMMYINLWSMIYCTRLFLPLLLNNNINQQCYIINTGSIASIQAGDSFYSVTKHAVIGFSETITRELKYLYRNKYGKNVQCNIFISTLCPAFVKNTNMRNTSAKALDIDINQLQEYNQESMKTPNKRKSVVTGDTPNAQIFAANAIEPDQVSKILFDQVILAKKEDKKTVVHTHKSWSIACIEDRRKSMLEGKENDAVNMKKAVRESTKRNLAKL